jgi:hypothetical protein
MRITQTIALLALLAGNAVAHQDTLPLFPDELVGHIKGGPDGRAIRYRIAVKDFRFETFIIEMEGQPPLDVLAMPGSEHIRALKQISPDAVTLAWSNFLDERWKPLPRHLVVIVARSEPTHCSYVPPPPDAPPPLGPDGQPIPRAQLNEPRTWKRFDAFLLDPAGMLTWDNCGPPMPH